RRFSFAVSNATSEVNWPWQLDGKNSSSAVAALLDGNRSSNGTGQLAVVAAASLERCRISVQFYALAYLALVCLCLLVEALLVRFSLLGSVLHRARDRWPVPGLLYCRLALMLVELCWLLYCAVSLWQLGLKWPDCTNQLWPVRALTGELFSLRQSIAQVRFLARCRINLRLALCESGF
uniref:Transmembrane protein n=1 Tax=Macrostomum lignano TaxID=282301 RepID=A0A1I8HD63_9PLAT